MHKTAKSGITPEIAGRYLGMSAMESGEIDIGYVERTETVRKRFIILPGKLCRLTETVPNGCGTMLVNIDYAALAQAIIGEFMNMVDIIHKNGKKITVRTNTLSS